jgi:hypothetical protein
VGWVLRCVCVVPLGEELSLTRTQGQDSHPYVLPRTCPNSSDDSTDVRCNMEDAKVACSTGVDGVDLVIGTSSFLREFSHGKDMAYITKTAIEVIQYVKRYAVNFDGIVLLQRN